jgi:polyisoprenoid-binding protein YceI
MVALKTVLSSVSFFLLILVFRIPAIAAEATVDVDLIPGGDFKAKVTTVEGFATLDGNKIKAENIKVILKNIKTGVALRDQHTKKYLMADQYDAILVKGEGENGKGKGKLKIKNIEKDVAGTYTVQGNEVLATFKVKLSDYDITGIKYMGVGVEDEVILNVRVPLKRAARTQASR